MRRLLCLTLLAATGFSARAAFAQGVPIRDLVIDDQGVPLRLVGYGLVIAQELFSVADVFAWTLVLVVILFLAEAVLSLVEERMLRWRT